MPETARGGSIAWKAGHIDAKSQQRLTIRLVPRQNRPFDLGVRWEFKPTSTQAMIDVQEPKLALKLEGPFPFSMTGVLASFIQPLADAGIPIFAISTFDTDYVLVKRDTLRASLQVLANAGHEQKL